MRVKDLREMLAQFPDDMEVVTLLDYSFTADIVTAWQARNGEVMLSDGDLVTDDMYRPVSAPSAAQAPYWYPPVDT